MMSRKPNYGAPISGFFILAIATTAALALQVGGLGEHFHGQLHKLLHINRDGIDLTHIDDSGGSAIASSENNRTVMPVPPTVLGMNMGAPNYYSTEWIFNDPIQSTGELYYYPGPNSNAVPFVGQTSIDANDRPVDLAAGTRIQIAVQNDNGEPLSGRFECRIAPGWVVTSVGRLVSINQKGSRFIIDAPKDQRGDSRFVLDFTAKIDHASLNELSCLNTTASGLFNPAFLDDVRPFRIVRFMDWMRTNGAPLRKWAERPTPRFLSQAGGKGVSLEDMVALCTQLQCDPWFNMPLDVDANYYRQFAIYVRDHLPKDRKVYVELSNEVWNTAFSQGQLATDRGHQEYSGVSDIEANTYYYADRVRQLMKIWDDVFAGQQGRLVRVYASQAAWAQRAQIGLSHDETWRSVDVLAIAPYLFQFLQEFPGTGKARIDAAFAKAPALIDQAMHWSLDNKAIAQHFGLRLVAYEGGQHYFAFTPDASADLDAMQRDPRMYDLYTNYLNRWQHEIGGPLVLYASTGLTSFAHKRYTGQPLSDAPKMRAVVDFINRNK